MSTKPKASLRIRSVSEAHRGNAQQAIVDAATRIIRSRGVIGITIAQIVAESGTSAGAIYHHFPNKRAVVMAVARQALKVPLQALDLYRSSPSSPQELLAFALTALRVNPDLSDLLVQLGAGAAADDEIGRELSEAFGELRDEVDITLFAWADQNNVPHQKVLGLGQLVVGLTLGFATQRDLVSSFDADAYFDQAITLLAIRTEQNTSHFGLTTSPPLTISAPSSCA